MSCSESRDRLTGLCMTRGFCPASAVDTALPDRINFKFAEYSNYLICFAVASSYIWTNVPFHVLRPLKRKDCWQKIPSKFHLQNKIELLQSALIIENEINVCNIFLTLFEKQLNFKPFISQYRETNK